MPEDDSTIRGSREALSEEQRILKLTCLPISKGPKSAAIPKSRSFAPSGAGPNSLRALPYPRPTPGRWCAGARQAGLTTRVCNHSFRATGITAYLKNRGTLEKAAGMANHSSTRTTQLYDRRSDEVTLDEVERVGI